MLDKNLKVSIDAIINSDANIADEPVIDEILELAEKLNTLSALAESQHVKLLKKAIEIFPKNMWPTYHLANYYVLHNLAHAKIFASKTLENYNGDEDFDGSIYFQMSEIIERLAK